MTGRLIAGIAVTVVLAGCANSSAASHAAPALPVNPSPLAHQTYDCAVLERAPEPNAAGPLLFLEPFDDGGSGQSRMCSLDWDGKFRRQLERGLAVRQSADGSRLLAIDYPIVNNEPAVYVAIDERNQVLDRLSTIWKSEALWADDNRRLCYIQDSNPAGQAAWPFSTRRVLGTS